LPIHPPELGADIYLDLMATDKKVEAGRIRLVLLSSLGRAEIQPVDRDLIRSIFSKSPSTAQ
jgi:3-dehydroquinate synthase